MIPSSFSVPWDLDPSKQEDITRRQLPFGRHALGYVFSLPPGRYGVMPLVYNFSQLDLEEDISFSLNIQSTQIMIFEKDEEQDTGQIDEKKEKDDNEEEEEQQQQGEEVGESLCLLSELELRQNLVSQVCMMQTLYAFFFYNYMYIYMYVLYACICICV